MIRLAGIVKVISVLLIDFLLIFNFTGNSAIAAVITAIIMAYVCFGGYIELLKERAVNSMELPSFERERLESAALQLQEDVLAISAVNIPLKVYLVNDDDLQATAYGANCVSVTRGTLNYADPITLKAVLAHEVSHILNFDPEFNRAVFCTVTIFMGMISIMSAIFMVIIFLICLIFNCFKSWKGFFVFKGITKFFSGIFHMFQLAIVVIYRTIISILSRRAEYRSDSYSCDLGYGLQLSHFLSIIAKDDYEPLTLTEALYQTHPETYKRVARIEAKLNSTECEISRS